MEDVPRHGFVLSSTGGIVMDWQVEGKPILYPYQELEIGGERKTRGGMFFCFPNFGTVDPKFHLPQHGKLRTLEGVRQHDLLWGSEVVDFETDKLFGRIGRKCKVSISARSGPSERELRTLYYNLWASLPKSPGTINPMRISPGIHPYFATPEGVASVQVGTTRYPVGRLITEPEFIPFGMGQATVTIPGVGIIDMKVNPSMCPRTVQLVLWRDSYEYVCVEPIYARPEEYDTLKPYFLREGGAFSAQIVLRLR